MTPARVVPTASVVLAAVVAGALFAPVFGLPALALPLVTPALVVAAVAVPCSRREALTPWRPILTSLAGLLVVVEMLLFPTTVAGIPTGATASALGQGVTESWRLALQSTWPAQPDAALLLFVPLLTVAACVLGIELLHHAGALAALVPSFAVLVLSQVYTAATGGAAVIAALAYAAAAATLFAATSAARAAAADRRAAAVLPAVPAVVLAVAGALVGGLLLPSGEARYRAKNDEYAPLADSSVTNPLDEVAYRLAHPNTPVFTVTGDTTVDRWPVVVLNDFNGVNWEPGDRYRRLGAALPPGPEIAVNVEQRTARLSDVSLGGPWVPSQPLPAAARGMRPLVEERQGSLLVPEPSGPVGYTLSWWEPQVTAKTLQGAAIDRSLADAQGGLGQVPPRIAELADEAVPTRPTLQAALALERFLRDGYRLATGESLPSGHSWPQLEEFLLHSKRGTSEQFAAAYVALARIKGIPARLVVGFRAPDDREPGAPYTVHNGDVLAWPEVAVEGVGWIPLDPTGSADRSDSAVTRGLPAATAEVREELPATGELTDPEVAPEPAGPGVGSGGGWSFPWLALLVVPPLGAVTWLVGVPLAKGFRAWRRRRRPGVGTVIGAWEEARDQLRAYGVPVSAGMTVRDLTTAVAATDGPAVAGLRSLGATVDVVLWSGAGSTVPGADARRNAWAAVRAVRKGFARRGLGARIRAALNPAPLRRPS